MTFALAKYKQSLKILVWVCLVIWFVVPFLGGIIFVQELNKIFIGHVPLGFWIAQQGSIYAFLVILLLYLLGMNTIEKRYIRELKEEEFFKKG